MAKRVALYSLGSCLAVVVGLVWLQDSIIYHPRQYESHSKYYERVRMQFEFETNQKIKPVVFKVNGHLEKSYYIPPLTSTATTPTTTWVLLGGNAQLALDWLGFVSQARKVNEFDSHGFLLFEFPGYGSSTGKLSQSTVHLSLAQAILAINVNKVNILAHSLGCAVGLNFASQHPQTVHGLVLVSPFASIPSMALDIFAFGTRNWLLQRVMGQLIKPENEWNNLDLLPRLRPTTRITIIHGDRDEIVPVHQGRLLFETAQQQEQLVQVNYLELAQADHNSITLTFAQPILTEMSKL